MIVLKSDDHNAAKCTQAINSLAIPVVSYSFGMIGRSVTYMGNLDTQIEKLLN